MFSVSTYDYNRAKLLTFDCINAAINTLILCLWNKNPVWREWTDEGRYITTSIVKSNFKLFRENRWYTGKIITNKLNHSGGTKDWTSVGFSAFLFANFVVSFSLSRNLPSLACLLFMIVIPSHPRTETETVALNNNVQRRYRATKFIYIVCEIRSLPSLIIQICYSFL